MERPTLNPSLFEEADAPEAPKARHGGFLSLIAAGGRIASTAWRVLWRPIFGGHARATNDDHAGGSAWGKLVVRLTVLAILLLITVFSLVHLLAHPPRHLVQGPPASAGVLVEPVTLQASDGINSEAWLAPAVDEKRIRTDGDAALRAISPAVLLVPDPAGDGRELDGLISALHDRGFVVMLARLRGTSSEIPHTYGLTEHRDVAAAIAHLRTLSFVDRRRISIIASGIGASAALLASKADRGIERVLVHAPLRDFEAVLNPAVNAPWLRPACRWGFEMMHQVDTDELDLDPLLRATPNALVLSKAIDRRGQGEMIGDYLQAQQISAAR
jgi:hypothetical protein